MEKHLTLEKIECKAAKIYFISLLFLSLSIELLIAAPLAINRLYLKTPIWPYNTILVSLLLILLIYSILTEVLFLKFLRIEFNLQYLFSFVPIALILGVFLIYVIPLITSNLGGDPLFTSIISFLVIIPICNFLFSSASGWLKDRMIRNKVQDKNLYEKYKEISVDIFLGKFKPTSQKAIGLK